VVSDVFILEQHEEVASITEESFIKLGLKNIWVRRSNPLFGLEEEGPFDKILICGAIPFFTHQLLDQLAENGIAVFPMMLTDPNQQIIFQIIKRKKEIEIVNFGSVIFQPLYFTEIPKIDKEKDITIETVIKNAREFTKPELIERKDFFEDFRHLPNLQLNQLVFNENSQILHSAEITKDVIKNLVSQVVMVEGELQEVALFKDELKISLYNPLSESFVLHSLRIQSPETAQIIEINDVLLEGEFSKNIEFLIEIPLAEGSYQLLITCIGPKNYRIVSGKAMIYVLKNEDIWDFSIEFEGKSEN
jgi:Protein-L-isoaspartate(D-aspartate) O-methyltransferase (PCMT)